MENSTTLTNTWDSTLFTSTSLPAPFTAYVPESMKGQIEELEATNVKNSAENTVTNGEMELSLMGIYNKEQLQEQQRRRREKELRAHERHHYKNYLKKHTHNNSYSKNKNNSSADECKEVNTAHNTEKEEKCATQEMDKQNLNDAKRNECEEKEIEPEESNKNCNNANEPSTPTPTIATMTLSEALHPQVAPLSIHQVQRFAQQIVNGLLFLHTHGYAHLDVKTANVLVTSNEECRLADLGCAMRLQPIPTHPNSPFCVNSSEKYEQEEMLEYKKELLLSEEEKQQKNHDEDVKSNAHRYRVLLDHDGITELRGTALYMAPEMIRFERLNIGSAADIWSLGCVMMEMATGQAPWRHIATDKLKVLFRVGSARTELPLPPLLRAWNEEAEEWLETHHQECHDHYHRIPEKEKEEYYGNQVSNAEQNKEEDDEDDDNIEYYEYGESTNHKCYSPSHPRHRRRRRLENNRMIVEEEKENEHDEIECRLENDKSSCRFSGNVTTDDDTNYTRTTAENQTNENLGNNTCKVVLQSENTHASVKKSLHYNSSMEVSEEEEESIQELSANSSNETLSHVSDETAIFYSNTSNHRHICSNDSQSNIKNENSYTYKSHKPTCHATSIAMSVSNGGGYIPITPGSEEANFNAAHSASYPPGPMTDIDKKTLNNSCCNENVKNNVQEGMVAREYHRPQRSKRQRSHGNNIISSTNRQSSHANNTTKNTIDTHLLNMSSDYVSYQHRLMTMYVALTDFIECCVRIAPDERWTIEELAEHPFLHM